MKESEVDEVNEANQVQKGNKVDEVNEGNETNEPLTNKTKSVIKGISKANDLKFS
jgi:hypothetical protein